MATQNQNIQKELLALEKQYWQALKDKDIATCAKLTDETCIVAGATGVARMDRAKLEQMMKSATYEMKAFEVDDKAEVQVLGDDQDVAILAYKVREELTVDGKPVHLEAADTSTWVRRDGRWLCAMHTESLTGDPFGRDRRSARPES